MAVLRPLHYVFCCTLRPPSMAPGYYRYYFRGKCTLIDISILNPSYCTKLVHYAVCQISLVSGEFASFPVFQPSVHISKDFLSLHAFYRWWELSHGGTRVGGEYWGPSPIFLNVVQCVFKPCSGARVRGSRNLFVRAHLESLSNPHCLSACPSVTEVLIIFPTIRFY